MNDVMIDIETLGASPGSVITQIGAVVFDRFTGETKREMSWNIEIHDSINAGLRIESGALQFWFAQQVKTFMDHPLSLRSALGAFFAYCKDFKNYCFWAHASFDFPIIEGAFKAMNSRMIDAGYSMPIPYRNMRDIRTLVDLAGIPFDKTEEREVKTHDALENCLRQVRYCVQCFNALKTEIV